METKSETKDSFITTEAPRNLSMVTLPEVTVSELRVRLGMHTDTTLNLLKYFEERPGLKDLKVQVRIITAEQWERLQGHPTFKLFMSGRVVRAQTLNGRIEPAFIAADSLGLSPEQIIALLPTSFTPSALAKEFGFKIGYLTVFDLTKPGWEIKDYSPLIGACNELVIGSNSLSTDQLGIIGGSISQYLLEHDSDVGRFVSIPVKFTPASQYKIKPVNYYQKVATYLPLTKSSIDDLRSISNKYVEINPASEKLISTGSEKERIEKSKINNDKILPILDNKNYLRKQKSKLF